MKTTGILISTTLISLSGCSSPLDSPSQGPVLDPHLQGVIDREMSLVESLDTEIGLDEPDSSSLEPFSKRMAELEGLTPVPEGFEMDLDLGLDLNGNNQRKIPIDMQAAIQAAVLNNLNLQSARLKPAIEREEVIQAEAVFDVVLGAGYSFTRTRSPNQSTQLSSLPGGDLSPNLTSMRTNDAEVSLSKELTSGGRLKLSTDVKRVNNEGSGNITYSPNPYWNPSLTLDFSQPILRGFGEKVTLASVAITRKREQEAIETLRQQLIDTVTDTETAYWNLAFAWRSLAIQEWLVDASIQLRDIVGQRRGYDASLSDWAQAVATVKQRQADVIDYLLSVKEASDALKVLMNDPRFPLAGETILSPVDEMVHTPVTIDFRSALLTAISMRPDVRNSIYELDIAGINEVVADNARLPELDFQAQVSSTGMKDGLAQSFEDRDGALGGDFISYVLGLTFEYPLGNRAPEAAFRQARMERSSAMVDYRTSIQTTILDVKSAMRKVVANAELINATIVARYATAESLRALEVERETLASLTPTFLNLLFSTQASLAAARLSEFQAIVNFNTSVADLYQAMGTILDMHHIGLEQLDEYVDWSSAFGSSDPADQ